MSQQELLKKVVHVLEDARIDYMLTGSLVSSLQGEPRLTHDIDVVVALQKTDARKVVEAFSAPDFYVDEKSVVDAIERRSQFNVLSTEGGDNIDFWLLTDDPFDLSRFARKQNEEVFGTQIKVSRPEDTILVKLRWAKLSGGSEKQFGDALRVYEVQKGDLDLDYLNSWAARLDIESIWRRIQKEAV
jgi:hypothetical protein